MIRKVLLVDDDPDIRKIGRLSLTGVAKWEVCLASNGKEALELAALEKPDVILLDISMPEMDGVATLGKLREQTQSQGTPIIMTTSRPEDSDAEACLQIGAVGVIRKPFNPTTLPNDISNIVQPEG